MAHVAHRVAREWPRGLQTAAWASLDIETTGLDARRHQITVVGIMVRVGSEGVLHQFFADDPEEEAAVLASSRRLLEGCYGVITYNGTRFDVPFLASRAQSWGQSWPGLRHLDLFPHAVNWPARLPDHRLQTMMAHFGLGRLESTGGSDAVRAYEQWLHRGDAAAKNSILAHNADDVIWLPELWKQLTAGRQGERVR